MKQFVYLVICLSIFFSCQNKNTKQENKQTPAIVSEEDKNDLMNVITRFARAYLTQDNQKANALIHPDLGLLVVYRPGAIDTFAKVDSLDFKTPIPIQHDYEKFSNQYALEFGQLPKIDCSNMKWDKQGFYCDTTHNTSTLENLYNLYSEIKEPFPLSKTQIDELQVDTYRVILVDQDSLIFHIKRYQGKWYVTLLDRAYASCDA